MAERSQAVIFGAGDVVAARLLPALRAARFARHYVLVHTGICDVSAADDVTLVNARSNDGGLTWLAAADLDPDTPVFIATPPEGRAALIKAACALGLRVISEKPLWASASQRRAFQPLRDGLKDVFCLGYYVQEKALAWTWIHDPRPEFADRLDARNGTLETARRRVAQMGRLQALSIEMCEGHGHGDHLDRPAWHQTVEGGVWYDMGVHILMMALIPFGASAHFSPVAERCGVDQYRLAGPLEGAIFEAKFGKHFKASEVSRRLIARYQDGEILIEFESGETTIISGAGETVCLQPRDSRRKYASLVALADRFLTSGWPDEGRYDLVDLQRQALDHLDRLHGDLRRADQQ